jgi:selenocysteine lyase/cysteine desulfurase
MGIMAMMLRGTGGVITMEDEFPSTTLPWKNLGYSVDFAVTEKGRHPDETLKAILKPEHRILLASYVQYRTGYRQNLEAIGRFCRSEGLLFGVNATQAMGIFPIDVEQAGIDFLVFSGLKWACAGYGTAGIFISRRLLKQYTLPIVGWRSVAVPEEMNNDASVFREDVAALEAGSSNFPSVFALGGALQLFNTLGKDTCMKRVLYLSRVLERTLLSKGLPVVPVLDESTRSGIILVKTPDAARLTAELLKRKIVVSARGVGLRVSVNIFNHEEDIENLAYNLKKLM